MQAVKLYKTGVMSWRDIARQLNVPKSTVSDYLRRYGMVMQADERFDKYAFETYPEYERNERILIISDMHLPYTVKGLIPFLQGLKDKYNPTRVICIGDELDYHYNSFHDTDPDLLGARCELDRALATIQELHAMFPQMDLLDSNHGSMVYRKAKHHGIPRHHLKSYNEVLGVGKGWVWSEDLTLKLPNGKPVYFHHGKTADGIRMSQTMGMSTVQGHHHNEFSIRYWANSLDLYFSLQVGCLIDNESYAFAYNNVNLKKPIIGCALIINSIPILEAYPL